MRNKRFLLLTLVLVVIAGLLSASAYAPDSNHATPHGAGINGRTLSVVNGVSGVTPLSGSAAFVPQSFAAPRAGPNPDLPPIWCIGVTHNVKATGTNTWSQSGTVKNNCGATIHSGIIVVSDDVSCSGTIQNSYISKTGFIPDPWASGVTYGYAIGGEARCEVCRNGVPVGFPPMTLTLNASAAGDSGSPNYQEYDGDGPQRSLTLTNSSTYAFPCP